MLLSGCVPYIVKISQWTIASGNGSLYLFLGIHNVSKQSRILLFYIKAVLNCWICLKIWFCCCFNHGGCFNTEINTELIRQGRPMMAPCAFLSGRVQFIVKIITITSSPWKREFIFIVGCSYCFTTEMKIFVFESMAV